MPDEEEGGFPPYPPEFFNEETAKKNPYASKQESLIRNAEKVKDSHKPRKPIEEYDNLQIPQVFKNKLVEITNELEKRNKENRAIAYAMSIANDIIEKLQQDLLELTEVVKDLKSNSSLYMVQDEDEKLLSKGYDANVDIDTITGTVLKIIEDKIPKTLNKNTQKGRFNLSKKELIVCAILFLLVISNSYFIQMVNRILSFGNKDALTSEYRIKKGDFGVCTTKTDSTPRKLSLKEDSKLNVGKDTDGKIWFVVGEYYCYVDSYNKN